MSMNFGPEWMRKKVIPTNYDAGTNLSNINNNTMDSYSKGKTVMNDHKVGSNQYKYSKDEVISLWNNKKKPNNKKMSFDYDKNISSTTEPLHPMSMMSFNNYDKKILGQNSVNNDMTSRTSRDFNDRPDRDMGHYKDRNDNRMNSRPFSYNRGSYDQMANGRNDYSMDSNKKFGNIWDSQNRTNNYVGNNMYSLKNSKNDLKKPKYKSMSTPLDKDMEMDGVQPNNMDKLNMKDNTNDLASTFDNMTLKTNYGNDKPLNNSLFSNDIFSPFKSNSLNVTKTQSFDDTMKKTLDVNKMDSTRLQGNIFSEPDTVKEISKEIVIEPPKWNYKDPTGKVQGPFLYEEMQEWYNAGYFEKNLPIKRENDVEFKSLASMIEQYGEEKPFIIDAEKYKKEKELSLKASEAAASTTAVHPPVPSTTANSKPTIKPIQKTMPSSTHQSSLDTTVTSPIGNKTLPMTSYSVGGGIGLGRGIGIKDNNSFSNNLDSMYNSFNNNNSVNSPKVYSGRNASFPSMGNQYEQVGYPGMNRLSNTMNNPQMMGIPGSQQWVPYNDPSMLGVKGWNDMMGFNDIYNNQFYNYDVMNPDLNKSNFNQHYYYQQLMQQSQFPPQYYQMMRQMPQNQMPFYNMFGQPINAIGMKPQMVPSTVGSMQNEIIPPMNTTTTSTTATTTTTTTINNTQSIFSQNDANGNASQNTNNNMWNSTPQTTINNININTNKAEKNKTDSIPIVDNTNTNTNTEKLNENTIQNNEKDTNEEDIVNDIPINEANTENKDEVEEVKESEQEQKEELKTEIINEETQDESEKEEEIVEEDDVEEENEIKEEEENEEENNEELIKDDDEESKEDNSLEKTEEIKEEVKITVPSAPVKNHWKISTNKTQRLSIKEIQELEEKEKLEQLKKEQEIKEKKEKEAAKIAAEAAVVTEPSPVSHFDSNTVWGAPHNNIQKPTLRQIMQEEENNKKKQKDLQMKEAESKKINKPTPHPVNTTRSVWAGRPLTIVADGNSKVVSASSLNAAKKEPVKKEIISSASSARPQSSQISTSINNTPTTAKSENEWTPVGKVVKKSEPSHKITKTSSKADNSKKGPSDAFMKWCKNTLRVSTSAGVNVDEFINVLLLMPLNETSVIYDICTDTLGGITAIDPLKFAEEFIKRRKMDQNADQSFSAVRGYNSYSHDENKNSNKFIPVKSGKKKNRQNLN